MTHHSQWLAMPFEFRWHLRTQGNRKLQANNFQNLLLLSLCVTESILCPIMIYTYFSMKAKILISYRTSGSIWIHSPIFADTPWLNPSPCSVLDCGCLCSALGKFIISMHKVKKLLLSQKVNEIILSHLLATILTCNPRCFQCFCFLFETGFNMALDGTKLTI